jgi:alcohol dehydrogenase
LKGLVLTELGKIKLQEVENPRLIADTDVIIKITLTTICGSDIHLLHGEIPSEPPFVLGHEYTGVIEEVGKAVKKFKPGDRVAGPAAPYCGQCENCLKGNIQQCLNGGIHGSGPTAGNLSGTQSEYIRVPFADVVLIKIPDNIRDEQAIFIGDILSTGFHALDVAGTRPGDKVVIFGAGPVGLSALESAKLFGASQIILVDYNQFRLDVAKKMGATGVIRADEDVLDAIAKLTDGRGADIAVEAAGDAKAFREAALCLGVGGCVSVVGIGKEMSIPLPQAFVKNITVKMGLGYLGNMKRLLKLYESGKINLEPLFTHQMKLAEIEEGYCLFEKREDNVIKIAITI